MARIAVHEPVAETREMIERLVRRLGHEVVAWDDRGATDAQIDVLLFEPASPTALAHARLTRVAWPSAGLVACSAAPPGRAPGDLHPLQTLTQPFSPTDLARTLALALATVAPAAPPVPVPAPAPAR
jgi:hypothetical protein